VLHGVDINIPGIQSLVGNGIVGKGDKLDVETLFFRNLNRHTSASSPSITPSLTVFSAAWEAAMPMPAMTIENRMARTVRRFDPEKNDMGAGSLIHAGFQGNDNFTI